MMGYTVCKLLIRFEVYLPNMWSSIKDNTVGWLGERRERMTRAWENMYMMVNILMLELRNENFECQRRINILLGQEVSYIESSCVE